MQILNLFCFITYSILAVLKLKDTLKSSNKLEASIHQITFLLYMILILLFLGRL